MTGPCIFNSGQSSEAYIYSSMSLIITETKTACGSFNVKLMGNAMKGILNKMPGSKPERRIMCKPGFIKRTLRGYVK